MTAPRELSESVRVAASPHAAYAVVADVTRLARWSPECIGVWVTRRRPDGAPSRFIGWNRKGLFLWFTTCRVTVAEPGEEFAFEVTSFGLPVARWGYKFRPSSGGTEITEYWRDNRHGRTIAVLSRVFTGTKVDDRAEINRAGMRSTLARLAVELNSAG
jgi:hypothetical protein